MRADLRQALSFSLPDHCTTCFHLAAVCKEPGYPSDEYYLTNYVGTKNLCSALTRSAVRNIIFTSTMMVYASGDERKVEESQTSPETAYGTSKLLAEEVLLGWAGSSPDRRLRIVRPGVVFGPGENGNFTRLYKALRAGVFHYVGRRTTVKSSIYVKDLISCLAFLSQDSGSEQLFNAVFPEPHTIEEISRTFQRVFGFRRVTPTLPYRLSLATSYVFELANALGFQNSIHHRRIEKLYRSTNLSSQRLCDAGFRFQFGLASAIQDWKASCEPGDIG
jgi:nucleoside-diphosphate-sugar epimerase